MTESNHDRLAVALGELQTEMTGCTSGAFLSALDDAQLHPAAAKALHLLARAGHPLSVSELAQTLHISLPSASRHSDALADRGLIARRISCDDRRSKELCVTDAGRQLLERLRAARAQDLRDFTATFSPQAAGRAADAIMQLLARSAS